MREILDTDELWELSQTEPKSPYEIWSIRGIPLKFYVSWDIVVIKNNDFTRPHLFRDYEGALFYARTAPVYKNVVTFKIYGKGKLLYVIQARKKPVTNIDTDEEDKEEQPVPQPKLSSISGGKDGVGNWLIGLAEGSVFSCVEKESDKTKKNYVLTQFHVMKKWAMSVYLMSNFPRQQSGEVLVHSLRFSQQNDLIEILQDGESEYVERSED